ncbi:unnamed protein product [Owenia fusiformis]|uniref:Uncharacterized protein n=1 Tax=Owenia fusiformis TaxID=6347 RepID=A0A8J1TZJ0_OWEFU|nr:unnamed protein product [Owenia fusiformis]
MAIVQQLRFLVKHNSTVRPCSMEQHCVRNSFFQKSQVPMAYMLRNTCLQRTVQASMEGVPYRRVLLYILFKGSKLQCNALKYPPIYCIHTCACTLSLYVFCQRKDRLDGMNYFDCYGFY